MKNQFLTFCIYLSLGIIAIISLNAVDYVSIEHLDKYKEYIEFGNNHGVDWSMLPSKPKSRYYTFRKAFQHFEKNNGRIVVELGTTRSFVDGRFVGCNMDDAKYWEPTNPEKWDWGAGCFTYLAAECLSPLDARIYTVDLMESHINRCKKITSEFKNFISYHVCSSLDFLKKWDSLRKIDLLYIDTGDITPVEATAELQLAEAKIIVERDLIAPNGIILIDDVKHPAPIKIDHDKSGLGKAKYSVPYFLSHGFELVEAEFQYILKRK